MQKVQETTRYNELQSHLDADLLVEFPFLQLSKGISLTNLDPRYAAARRQSECLLKKQAGNRTDLARTRAIVKWLKCNNECAGWQVPLPSYELDVLNVARSKLHSRFCHERLGHTYGLLKEVFEPRPEEGMFGPGKTQLCEDESYYLKSYGSANTFTQPELVAFYWQSTRRSPSYAKVERLRQTRYGTKRVQASNLITVPKTSEIDRVICIEPKLNMFYQQAVRKRLEVALKDFFKIDLSKQPTIHQQLAKQASIDGKLSTIDLSAASDRISYAFCQWFLPPALFNMINVGRSGYVDIKDHDQQQMQ